MKALARARCSSRRPRSRRSLRRRHLDQAIALYREHSPRLAAARAAIGRRAADVAEARIYPNPELGLRHRAQRARRHGRAAEQYHARPLDPGPDRPSARSREAAAARARRRRPSARSTRSKRKPSSISSTSSSRSLAAQERTRILGGRARRHAQGPGHRGRPVDGRCRQRVCRRADRSRDRIAREPRRRCARRRSKPRRRRSRSRSACPRWRSHAHRHARRRWPRHRRSTPLTHCSPPYARTLPPPAPTKRARTPTRYRRRASAYRRSRRLVRTASAVVAGVTVPLPLFDRNQGAVARARAEATQARARARSDGKGARRRARARPRRSGTRREVARALPGRCDAPARRRSARWPRPRIKNGQGGIVELLDALTAITDAKLRELELRQGVARRGPSGSASFEGSSSLRRVIRTTKFGVMTKLPTVICIALSLMACKGKKQDTTPKNTGGDSGSKIDVTLCETEGKRVATYDLNKDGKDDVWRLYKGDAMSCKQVDFDHDGRKDWIVAYDAAGQDPLPEGRLRLRRQVRHGRGVRSGDRSTHRGRARHRLRRQVRHQGAVHERSAHRHASRSQRRQQARSMGLVHRTAC